MRFCTFEPKKRSDFKARIGGEHLPLENLSCASIRGAAPRGAWAPHTVPRRALVAAPGRARERRAHAPSHSSSAVPRVSCAFSEASACLARPAPCVRPCHALSSRARRMRCELQAHALASEASGWPCSWPMSCPARRRPASSAVVARSRRAVLVEIEAQSCHPKPKTRKALQVGSI